MTGQLLALIKKEWLEFSISKTNLFFMALFLAFPIYLIFSGEAGHTTGLLKAGEFAPMFIAMAGIAGVGQNLMDSLLSEKKNKNFEVLLSSKLKPLTILAGKSVLPLGIGLLLSAAMAGILMALAHTLAVFPLAVCLNYLVFLAVFALITAIITILTPDEKVAAYMPAILVVAGLAYLRIFSLSFFTFANFLTLPVQLLILFMLAIAAEYAFRKSRIFLTL